jgi:hypothetical protein
MREVGTRGVDDRCEREVCMRGVNEMCERVRVVVRVTVAISRSRPSETSVVAPASTKRLMAMPTCER